MLRVSDSPLHVMRRYEALQHLPQLLPALLLRGQENARKKGQTVESKS